MFPKIDTRIPYAIPLLVGLFWMCCAPNGYAQNICLDFDGADDHISAFLPSYTTDFTAELWYNSASNDNIVDPATDFRHLFYLGGSGNSRFRLGLSGGYLHVELEEMTGSITIGPVQISTQFHNNNSWNHVALVRAGQQLEVYLNCQLAFSYAINTSFGFSVMYVGSPFGTSTIPQDHWLGKIEEVRLWNFAKTVAQIDVGKNCPCVGDEANLEFCWSLDEGVPAGNNTAITNAVDQSSNGYSGFLNNFTLTGTLSNYITSTAPFPSPYLNDMEVEIRDYPYQNNLLTEICPSDPAHFRLQQNGVTPSPSGNVTVEWFYKNNGGTPVALPNPIYGDFNFGVPQGNITYDCTSSNEGFVTRTFYAITSVTNPLTNDICPFRSGEYDLDICCPFSPATVDIAPPNPLCEGESVNVNVCLNSPDLFVQTPGPNVDIKWYYNGTYLGASFDDLTCFNYNVVAPTGISSPQSLCFEARLTNCANKTANFSSCLTVDPKPVCGTIDAFPFGSPLNLMATSDPNIYQICPDNDAKIGIDNPFLNCTPQWQYSFDQITWTNLGFSNSVQNTNILPNYLWPPGATSIYYRIECAPFSSPSGCDPCYGDTLEIQLKPEPPANSITGNNQLCVGDANTLTLATTNPGDTYTWYCDGIVVATGPTYSYTAQASACYWVETVDAANCYVVESPQFCVNVCEVTAVISCPLPPNDCACASEPITLSACDSESTCGNNLQFVWYIDGVPQSTSSCTITHTPAVLGSTYRVEVTDPVTGCTGSAERTVLPCRKNGQTSDQ
ncbi:MAG: LamG-like jellyroll fold domain-containing protein [Bacteroidota bacterium]